MRRKYTGIAFSFLFLTVFSLVSCQKEEDFAYEEGSTLPLVFHGEVVPYEDATVKTPQELSFWNGSTIYVRLEEGTKLLFGKAVYNEDTASWSFTYSGSLKGWNQTVSAKCYYLPETNSSNVAEITIDYTKPIYEATDATLTINANSVTLSAYLRPKTGRLSLGQGLNPSETRKVRILSGFSWYTRFSLKDYTFTSSEGEVDFDATSSNYLYGFFTNANNRTISLKYGSLSFSRQFPSNSAALQPGRSGYFSVPTFSHHDGWTMEGGVDTEQVEFTVQGVSFKMISVPGGTFMMGRENEETATPVHRVTLDSFMIGETEVTQELWTAVMGYNPSYYTGESNLPVDNFSWWSARVFLFKLSEMTGVHFRMPTEAEWEYAARESTGSELHYSGSDILSEVAWYGDNGNDRTHPVAQKDANALGIYDMSGNVWEMVSDWNYAGYSSEPQTNPRGYAYGSTPMLRGGSYCDGWDRCSSTRRNSDWGFNSTSMNVGLRLVCGGPEYEPEMVDLGLPSGLKWASFNIGATRPVEVGEYFAWGETTPKVNYTWGNYLFEQDGFDSEWQLKKYTFQDGYSGDGNWYENGVFTGDGRTVLEMEDDVARQLWKGDWRIPSPNDWQELIDNCSIRWTYEWDYNSSNTDLGRGMYFTGPNGNQIFLPAVGYRSDWDIINFGDWPYYPSSALGYRSSVFSALHFGENWAQMESISRHQGFPIRPVSGDGNNYGMELSTSQIYFGNAPVNDVSERVFQVKNTGYLPITVSLASDNSAFVVSPSSITIPAKQSMDFTVNFTPAEASSYSGTITVTPVEFATVGTISLNGTGINMVYETYNVGGVEFKMVPVPGGTFDMGMDSGRQVTVDDYYIGQTEVTQELWEAVMGDNPSSHTGIANLPVENVSWFNAKVFIERLNALLPGKNFHLPTEAEWEYAARGGSFASYDTYSGGNDLDAVAWHSDNSNGSTHPVKTKAPNYLGIYDMSGNVWEWCEGFYGELPDNGTVNPRGWPYNESKYPNYRGGSFQSTTECSVINRSSSDYEAESTSNNVGLRIALGGPSYSPEAIDLGLPSGVKWSSFNIGACAPEEIGGFYAWGETVQKTTYEWSNYSYMQPGYTDVDHLTKYSEFDSKTVLEAEDDVATTRWGAGWRIPTTEEWIELVSNTTTTPEQLNGVKGLRLTSSINGNSLFLPTCGYFTNRWCKTNVWDYGYSFGHEFLYPSSSLYIYGMTDAIMYRSDDYHIAWGGFDRYIGVQVRPVKD